MNISFQEKSIWVALVVTILIFGSYFTFAFSAFYEGISDPNADYTKLSALIPLFIGAIVLISVILGFLHIFLAPAFNKATQIGEDERDKLIALKATRISYIILVFGIWVTGVNMLWLPPLVMLNILAFFFFLAEIVGWSKQLFYYRRGV